QSWLRKLSLPELTYLVAAIGAVGLLLVLVGVLGIRKSRRDRRAAMGLGAGPPDRPRSPQGMAPVGAWTGEDRPTTMGRPGSAPGSAPGSGSGSGDDPYARGGYGADPPGGYGGTGQHGWGGRSGYNGGYDGQAEDYRSTPPYTPQR